MNDLNSIKVITSNYNFDLSMLLILCDMIISTNLPLA